ncbi:Response regulator CorP [Pseudomonas syringae pv. maculicola]|nr:Response regulator CorP [Pseudomonas syringae pv. maculicola]
MLTDVHALFRSSMVLMLEMRLPQKTVSEASTLDDVLTQDASLGS